MAAPCIRPQSRSLISSLEKSKSHMTRLRPSPAFTWQLSKVRLTRAPLLLEQSYQLGNKSQVPDGSQKTWLSSLAKS